MDTLEIKPSVYEEQGMHSKWAHFRNEIFINNELFELSKEYDLEINYLKESISEDSEKNLLVCTCGHEDCGSVPIKIIHHSDSISWEIYDGTIYTFEKQKYIDEYKKLISKLITIYEKNKLKDEEEFEFPQNIEWFFEREDVGALDLTTSSKISMSTINIIEPTFENTSLYYQDVVCTIPGQDCSLYFEININRDITKNNEIFIEVLNEDSKKMSFEYSDMQNDEKSVVKAINLTIPGKLIDKVRAYTVKVRTFNGSELASFPFVITDRPQVDIKIPWHTINDNGTYIPIHFSVSNSFPKKMYSRIYTSGKKVDHISECEVQHDTPVIVGVDYQYSQFFQYCTGSGNTMNVDRELIPITKQTQQAWVKILVEYREEDYMNLPFVPSIMSGILRMKSLDDEWRFFKIFNGHIGMIDLKIRLWLLEKLKGLIRDND